MDLKKVNVNLSENQFDKLRRGHQIQISAKNLKGGRMPLFVSPELAKKMNRAKRNNKGVRIQLSRAELNKSAEGLKDFLKKAKDFYDKHIKSHAGPILKRGLTNLANQALTEAEKLAIESEYGAPLVPLIEVGKRKVVPKVVDKVGDITGAFGMCCPHCQKVCGSFLPAGGMYHY